MPVPSSYMSGHVSFERDKAAETHSYTKDNSSMPQHVNLSPVHLYTQEPDPNKATLAKVIPTPNNGSAELVALQRDQVSSHINF